MYTIYEIKRAIGTPVFVARGQEIADNGDVDPDTKEERGVMITVTGSVKGSRKQPYEVSFTYNKLTNAIMRKSCTCPAFSSYGSCKHCAALMIDYMEFENEQEEEAQGTVLPRAEKREEKPAQPRVRVIEPEQLKTDEEILAECFEPKKRQESWSDYYARIARGEKLEREIRKAKEREAFLADIIAGADRSRGFFQPVTPGKLRLLPYFSAEETMAVFGLRVAMEHGGMLGRAYQVRNLAEFARKADKRESYVFGKELTFSFCEEDVHEDDLALYHAIVWQHYPAGTSGMIPVDELDLPMLMQALHQRGNVTWREDKDYTPMTVEYGVPSFDVVLQKNSKDMYQLWVEGTDTCFNGSGTFSFDIENKRIICTVGRDYQQVYPLLRIFSEHPDGIRLNKTQMEQVCTRVLQPLQAYIHMVRGSELLADNTPMKVQPRFYIDSPEAHAVTCDLRFSYNDGEEVKVRKEGETDSAIRRDTFTEDMCVSRAKNMFPIRREDELMGFAGTDDKLYQLLTEELPQLKTLGEVMISDRLANMQLKTRRTMKFGVSPTGGDLVLQSDLGGFSMQELKSAASAFREKRKFVRLKDGTFLSGEALVQAAEMASLLESLDLTPEEIREGAKIPAVRAMYIESALSRRDEIELEMPAQVEKWISRLRRAQTTRVDQPEGLQTELRDYQLVGLSWLRALCKVHFGGILADDMGLGKTVQALALLLHTLEKKEPVHALVVCPASLQLNWMRECERFTPQLTVSCLLGTASNRENAIRVFEEGEENLLITSYDQLKRDITLYRDMHFTHVFLDEAQNIKNAGSLAAKSVKLISADNRFAMTGTPIENRLSEMWSIFDYLMPGYLFSAPRFRDRFEAPIVRMDDEEARESLRMLVQPFILRRLKKDVLTDLPEKVETVMTAEMDKEQRKQYAAVAAQLLQTVQSGGMEENGGRMKVLAGLTRLRQLCCDPRLCLQDYSGPSCKLDMCMNLVHDMIDQGHRILLFSQFTSMLELIRQQLASENIEYFVLTGDTPKAERQDMADRFNGGEKQVFLISLKAGGTGLNLIGADVVIHYDPWWNTAAQSQATDRAYRIGQMRGVQVFSLVVQNTVEERIILMQEAKKQLSDSILEGDENLFTVDSELLMDLLKAEAEA